MPKESPPLWPSAEVDSDALDPHYKADISETCPSLGKVVARKSVAAQQKRAV